MQNSKEDSNKSTNTKISSQTFISKLAVYNSVSLPVFDPFLLKPAVWISNYENEFLKKNLNIEIEGVIGLPAFLSAEDK